MDCKGVVATELECLLAVETRIASRRVAYDELFRRIEATELIAPLSELEAELRQSACPLTTAPFAHIIKDDDDGDDVDAAIVLFAGNM